MPENIQVSAGRKLFIVLLIVSFFFIGFIASYKYVIQKYAKAQVSTPSVSALSPVNLSLTTDKNTVTNGKYFTVTMNLMTGDQTIDAADFVVNFDPKYIRVDKIVPGNFFKSYPANAVSKNSVKITGIATLSKNKVYLPKGTGTVATVSFFATDKSPKTTITFDKVKTVLASDGKKLDDRVEFADLDITIN